MMKIKYTCLLLLCFATLPLTDLTAQEQSDFRLELADGKVCRITKYELPSRRATTHFIPPKGIVVRVQGTIRVAAWGDETRMRGRSPGLLPKDAERPINAIHEFVPFDLNPTFEKPKTEKDPPANEYRIDSLYYAAEPFSDGILKLGDLTVELPALSEDDSIVRAKPVYKIEETELLREIKQPMRDSYGLQYEGSRNLTTLKPIVGAILKVTLAPMEGAEATIEETQVEFASGGRALCFAYESRSRVYIYSRSSRLRAIDFSKPPVLYFVVPPKTEKFTLNVAGQMVEGKVEPLKSE